MLLIIVFIITIWGSSQAMPIVHLLSHVCTFFHVIPDFPFFIADHHTDEVELFNFDLNKWESKNEWKYPFRRG